MTKFLSQILLVAVASAAVDQAAHGTDLCEQLEEHIVDGNSPQAICVTKPFANLESLFRQAVGPGADPISVLTTSSEARRQIHRIEQLSEAFREQIQPVIGKDLARFDELASRLGKYGDAVANVAFARQALAASIDGNGPIRPVDAELMVAEFELRSSAARKVLLKYLDKQRWLDIESGPLAKTARRIKLVKWERAKVSRKIVAQTLHDKLGEILKKKYDFSELEDGTHSLRKDVREILILVQSAYGIIELVNSGSLDPRLQSMTTAKYGAVVPHVAVKRSVKIGQQSYLELVAEEQRLGLCKDYGQASVAVASVMVDLKIATKEQSAELADRLARTHPEFAADLEYYTDIRKTTQSIAARLLADNGPINRLRSELKEQL